MRMSWAYQTPHTSVLSLILIDLLHKIIKTFVLLYPLLNEPYQAIIIHWIFYQYVNLYCSLPYLFANFYDNWLDLASINMAYCFFLWRFIGYCSNKMWWTSHIWSTTFGKWIQNSWYSAFICSRLRFFKV